MIRFMVLGLTVLVSVLCLGTLIDDNTAQATGATEDTASFSESRWICGDANGSGNVDIDDVIYLLQTYIFGAGAPPDPYESGDADSSGVVEICDVVYLVAYIFHGGPPPIC